MCFVTFLTQPGHRSRPVRPWTDADSVEIDPTVSLSLGLELFRFDPTLLRRRGRLCLAPLLGHVKRMAHQRCESLVRGDAVLLLASMVARDDPHHALGVQTRREFRPKSFALLVADDSRMGQIPEQLDSRG